MGRKRTPGLVQRKGVWHVDKIIEGRRICCSTGSRELAEAERFLAHLMEETRKASIYGIRPSRTFEEAAAKFVLENQHLRSMHSYAGLLQALMPWIGQHPIDKIHMGMLKNWIEYRKEQQVAPATINHGLKVIRRILNLAASEWIDEHGLTWLAHPPKIKLLPDLKRRKPYPLSWEEQDRLFKLLPPALHEMALFAVNTGCRESEITSLRWEWELKLPTLNTSVFLVPGEFVKNGDERLVVLNRIARSVVEAQRGKHPTHVFTYRGKPIKHMLSTGWRLAREKAGLPLVRVHDLKHTLGRRLRAANVSFEDRQDLLGHRSGRITTHYSAAELTRLIEAAEAVCVRDESRPELVVLRRINFS